MPNLDVDRLIAGWRGPALAALIAVLAGLPGVFAMPPLDRDEARYAQATSQMLETGDYVNINFQDQPRWKKPVGIHWLQAASVKAFSEPEARQIWAYRIPSLLGAALAAAACVWGATMFFGRRGAMLAGIAFACSFMLSTEAFWAKTDAVLTGCVTLAMAALARLYGEACGLGPAGRRTRWLFWIGVTGSILIKGPIGPLIVGLAMLWLVLTPSVARFGSRVLAARRARAAGAAPDVVTLQPSDAPAFPTPERGWLKRIGWGWGLILILAVVGPWAAAITVSTDGGFWGSALGKDLAPKLAGGHERHGGPFGYHTLLLPLTFYPGVLLLAAAIATAWSRRREPGVWFAVAWLVPSWFVFELAPTKLPHYTLPLFGALAWLVAASLDRPLGRISRWAGLGLAALAGALISGAAVYGLARFGNQNDVLWVSLTVGFALIGAVVSGFFLLSRQAATGLLVACVFGLLAHATLSGGVFPGLKPMWISRNLARTLHAKGLDPRDGLVPGPVAIDGYSEPSAVFLLGTRTNLGDENDAVEALRQGRPAVVEAKEQTRFHDALAANGQRAEAVAVVKGFNYSKGKPVTLTLYRAQGEPSR